MFHRVVSMISALNFSVDNSAIHDRLPRLAKWSYNAGVVYDDAGVRLPNDLAAMSVLQGSLGCLVAGSGEKWPICLPPISAASLASAIRCRRGDRLFKSLARSEIFHVLTSNIETGGRK